MQKRHLLSLAVALLAGTVLGGAAMAQDKKTLALVTNAGTRAPLLPLNVTVGSFTLTLRSLPVRVTGVPAGPRFGLKSEITGAGK